MYEGCTNLGRQIARATGFSTVALICCPSVWNLLYATLLETRILRWLLDFQKMFYTPNTWAGIAQSV